MASDVSDPARPESGAISFAVDRLGQDENGRVELIGRWYGVRGRRFVRPALTVVLKTGGNARRALAVLDDKPWAAEDGEPWKAAFPVEIALARAANIELCVAPDITVSVGPEGPGRSGPPRAGRSMSPGARALRVRPSSPVRPAAADRGRELELLRTQLDAAAAAQERERRHRELAERRLEQERAESERLRRELAEAETTIRRRPSPRPPPPERQLEPMSARLRALNKLEATPPSWAERPLNPSLRTGNWIVRGLAMIVVLLVLIAVVVLINSTVA